ncbi:DUF1735 and LamG domain-containing protein [uncultured Muribaculum sp.]|uniref:DUF1735 and LamG domain-containing protein n=1 Tax=uncultured Muribaculum sp. TaxID=1918613 RepID=UPI0025EB3D8C|nr:DUF1735 and LamG domain-containing protein [uncultured Muribaculum sp.]
MKKYILSLCAVAAIVMAGCDKGTEFNDNVFVTGALDSQNIRFNIDGQSTMALTVTSSIKAESDINVQMRPAPELLDAYNRKTGRQYQMPPEDAYSIEDGNVVIKSGSNMSTQMILHADSEALKEGVGYCLPVTISGADGGLVPMESARTVYILFTKVISIKVANLGRSGGYDIKGFWKSVNENTPVEALQQMTLEMKVFPLSFGSNPRNGNDISSLCGCEENFLFRFGDGAGNPTNKLQLAKGAIGADSHPNKKDHYDTWAEELFPTGRWLHFAAVYDGKYLRIYLDGRQIHFVETKNGGTINLSMAYNGHDWSDGFTIGRSAGNGRNFNGYISECRVWNVARTLDQLNNGICYVDPDSEGLVAYWRFDHEENGTVRDETGHGYDATRFGSVTYVDGQKCPY